MDVGRYDFDCQKALHNGLRLAKGYGHYSLEVEHVALAIVRDDASFLDSAFRKRLQSGIEVHLEKIPKRFGKYKIEFAIR